MAVQFGGKASFASLTMYIIFWFSCPPQLPFATVLLIHTQKSETDSHPAGILGESCDPMIPTRLHKMDWTASLLLQTVLLKYAAAKFFFLFQF